MTDITGAPFLLDKERADWVYRTLAGMSVEEKIGQLFVPIGYSTDREYLKNELLRYGIGGLFFRDGPAAEMQETFSFAQSVSKIPLLIPSNLEAGGDGAATDGTSYGKQMAAAAAGEGIFARRLAKVSCSEAAALGINWAFAPVADIDLNPHNPITNVRTYGSNPEDVLEYVLEYIKGAGESGVAACVKHFPGDGVDERDQHLLTSVNSLSVEEWMNTYGKIYKGVIRAGVMSIMAGHIALPACEKANSGDGGALDRIIPATLSGCLVRKLLREELGFNGLVISDATPMVGFTSAMDRKTAVPLCIENGCDMFLFNKDLAEDYHFMLEGYNSGILSPERLEEANLRILAFKAALRLPEKQAAGELVPGRKALAVIGNSEHIRWSRELADRSITLVKDTAGNLPLRAEQTPRVLLEILGSFSSNERVQNTFCRELEKRGFSVTVYEPEDFQSGVDTVASFRSKYDLVLYVGNVENASNKTTNRIDWYTFWGSGNNVPWFAREIPVVFVSLANPYHLLDVPMIRTYINAYSNNDRVIECVVGKLTGESAFQGQSPVDPFCGREELRF